MMRLPPFRLERYFAQHEFSAPYNLCASDCESVTIQELLALEPGAEARLVELGLGYTPAEGSPELREAVASLYETIDAQQILVHAGAQEAIFNFMHVTVRAGDHVIVHTPCYQSLGEVARALGAEVTSWRGAPSRGWALEMAELRRLLRPQTRLVIVNFPHNPTGFLPDHGFVRELIELAAAHGFEIFSDEVYRGLELDPADRLPALADLSPQATSLGVMSKTYGLAGLRVGWIATQDAEKWRAMAAFKDYTTICTSAPSEQLAALALRHAETLAARNRQIIAANLARLDAFFDEHAERFVWRRPKAGSIAFPVLRHGDVEAFCGELIADAGVLLLPGTLYDDPHNAFRVGFGRRDLPEALTHLSAHLARTSAAQPGS